MCSAYALPYQLVKGVHGMYNIDAYNRNLFGGTIISVYRQGRVLYWRKWFVNANLKVESRFSNIRVYIITDDIRRCLFEMDTLVGDFNCSW